MTVEEGLSEQCDDDIDLSGLEVRVWPLFGRVIGVYFQRTLGLRSGLDAIQRRQVLLWGLDRHAAGSALAYCLG